MRKPWLLSSALALCSFSIPTSLFAAEQPAIEVDSPHFHLVTTAGEKQARHLLDNFEHMRWVFQTLFPKANADPPAPILVIAARNRQEFTALEPSAYLAKGSLDLAGYFQTSQDNNFILVRLDIENEAHPFETVYHEYTHLQFRAAADWMPLWLQEGLAQFFENTDIKDKKVLLGEPNSYEILYLRDHPLIPLETLFQVDHDSPYYHQENKGSIFYAESWLLTHYLQVNDRLKNTNRLSDYVQRVSHHEDPVAAAQAAFGDLKKLKTDLDSYVHQMTYQQFVLNSAAVPVQFLSDPASYTVRTLTPAQYNADRAQLLANIGRTDDASILLETVLRDDPNNAIAWETKGFLAHHAGNIGAARDAYAKAVALDSGSFLAHYYYAALSVQTGGGDPKMEASLQTAIKLNPRFAPSYDLLAQIRARDQANFNEARTLELNAIELDHSNIAYRFNAASLQEQHGDFQSAKRILEAARPLARNDGSTAMLESRISEIDRMQAAQANSASQSAGSASAASPVPGDGNTPGTFRIHTEPPQHPTEAAGPQHLATGIIASVHCTGSENLELTLIPANNEKPLTLYTNNRTNLTLTTTNFDLPNEMEPCHALKGYQAEAQYMESSEKPADGQILGQILSLKLSKGAAAQLKHPTEPATTHRHQVSGSIQAVNCYGDSSLELTFAAGANSKPLLLYTNDRVNMDLTAFGFTPTTPIDPCTTLKNYRADLMYAESSDKTVDGQIIAIMLRKPPTQ